MNFLPVFFILESFFIVFFKNHYLFSCQEFDDKIETAIKVKKKKKSSIHVILVKHEDEEKVETGSVQ